MNVFFWMEYPHDHHKKKKINPKKPVYFECSRTIRVRMQRAWSDNREKQPRKWSAQISRAINSRRGKYSRQRRKKRGRWSDAYLSQLIHDVENIFHWKKKRGDLSLVQMDSQSQPWRPLSPLPQPPKRLLGNRPTFPPSRAIAVAFPPKITSQASEPWPSLSSPPPPPGSSSSSLSLYISSFSCG